MKIDRTNYEIWFVDWIDGKLNEEQILQIRHFLDENPDLKDEFEDLADFRAVTAVNVFPGKNLLKKSSDDIPQDQFELLCAAYFENDLSPDEADELIRMTTKDIFRKRQFALYGKLKLTPPDIKFRNRKKLFKITPVRSILRRTAVIGIAASIALLVLYYPLLKEKLPENPDTGNLISGNEIRPVGSELPSATINEKQLPAPAVNKESGRKSIASRNLSPLPDDNKSADSIKLPAQVYHVPNAEIQPYRNIVWTYRNDNQYNNLIHLKSYQPSGIKEKWTVSEFIAKNFRQKVLKSNASDVSPLKGYEIAEAGVSGLNKLFGWQMAFEKTSDAAGEVKSVYFSSKLLKIQAPVNRTQGEE